MKRTTALLALVLMCLGAPSHASSLIGSKLSVIWDTYWWGAPPPYPVTVGPGIEVPNISNVFSVDIDDKSIIVRCDQDWCKDGLNLLWADDVSTMQFNWDGLNGNIIGATLETNMAAGVVTFTPDSVRVSFSGFAMGTGLDTYYRVDLKLSDEAP